MAGRKIGEAFVAVKPEPDKNFGSDLDRKVLGRAGISGRKAGLGFGASFRTGLAPVLAGIGTLFAATGVVNFFKDSIAEQTESIKVGRQTAAVLKSTGGAANISADAIGNLATSLSNKIGVDDEAIQSNENLLLTFTNIRNEVGKGNDIFNQATAVVQDMSAALGQDGKSSAIQLGKALNDPIKGITALSRVGVSFTDKQKEQIKTLVKSGDTLKAQKIILGEVTREFGGSAAAIATPAEKMKVAWGNLKETVGGLVLPALSSLETKITGVALRVTSFIQSPGVTQFAKRVGGGIASARDEAVKFVRNVDWSPIIRVAQSLWTVITVDLIPVLRDLATSYGPAIKASLVFVFKALWSAISALSPVLLAVGAGLKAFGEFVANNKATVATFVGILLAYQLGLKAIALYGKIVAAVQLAWNAAMALSPIGLIVVGVAALAAGIVYLATRTRFFQIAWSATWGALKTAFHAVIHFINSDLGLLVLALLGPIGWLVILGTRWKTIWDGIKTAFSATVRFLRGLFADFIDGILAIFGAIVHGAATAFGWVPGIGGKLKSAAKAFDSFRAQVNQSLRGIHDRTVTVKVQYLGDNKIKAGLLHGVGVMAQGGIVKARPGGVLKLLAEAGQDEAVIPLGRDGAVRRLPAGLGGGGNAPTEVHFHFHDSVIASRKAAQDLVKGALDQLVRDRRIVLAKP